jgi:hypothetical protein
MTCIGHLTHNIRNATTELADIWINSPWRRGEFGERELDDIGSAVLALQLLLSAIAPADKEAA